MTQGHTEGGARRVQDAAETGSDFVVDRLLDERVAAVFLVPGLQVDPLTCRLAESPAPTPVCATHELSAGFMADGYARASDRIGVCIGVGSCGAANMLPAVAVASIDSSAVLFLTGNVPSSLQGFGAFQDGWPGGASDSATFGRFVRSAATVASRGELAGALEDALLALRHPYRAPVHLSIPFDVQREEARRESSSRNGATAHSSGRDRGAIGSHEPSNSSPSGCAPSLEEVYRALIEADRPCLLVGPRFSGADAPHLIRHLADAGVPVATTLSAKGILPEDHPLSLGVFGFAGSRRAHETILLGTPDVVLLLGADLNERDSSCWDPRLRGEGRRLIRVDSLSTRSRGISVDPDVTTDPLALVREWVSQPSLAALKSAASRRSDWLESVTGIPRTYPPLVNEAGEESGNEARGGARVTPLDRVVTSLRQVARRDAILVVDAGLHRVFAGHYWEALEPGTFYSACGTAPLGWAICASIGIQIARPTQPVFVLTGDGCMCAHGMELATMVRYALPIVVVVCNNQGYGSVKRRIGRPIITNLPSVDWTQLAESLGVQAFSTASLGGSLEEVFAHAAQVARSRGGPVLVEVATPPVSVSPHPEISRSALLEMAAASVAR